MNIMLLGAPGSGKGTLAEKLIKNQGFNQMSTGDLMRKEIKDKTPLGIECARYMNEGNLVPDEVTMEIVKNFLKDNHNQLIFDGIPRTLNQAKILEENLSELNSQIDKVIYIDVPTELLLERISGRLICPKCKVSYHIVTRKPKTEWVCDNDQTELVRRPDDAPEKVKVRLYVYANETAPLVDYYKNKPGFVHIVDNADTTAEEVYQEVLGAL
ncbi:adenylate kinase family protein [Mesoplasma melaleucae]|uniref:Adenylate kinase n=1 Tax=Mesoplasma melaleucae TaxID=81459 RepID=A0A2K8NV86_9MOLU|nr:nucleoside monophosphate kinase [Mesoplasma melaleucae]ATZ17752.1 adenylate kinase [Mesoplasma melaleucae]